MLDEQITLIRIDVTIVNGVSTETRVPSHVVWAKHKSATRAEYYQAEQAGHRVTDVFECWAWEYNGEQELMCGENIYNIVRAYRRSLDRIELNCERRSGM